MDNLTHSLAGALIGQTGLKKKTGLAMPALIIGANLPDVDAACFFWLEGTEHLGFRRGITHGPPALALLPLILAGLLWGFDRWQASRGKRPDGRVPVHFGWLYGLALLGCLTHPALDWMNVYGIRLLEPFSSQWFYGDVLFIIDVWLWALMGLGLWWSLRREKKGKSWRVPAIAILSAVLAYIGFNASLTRSYVTRDSDNFYDPVIASPVPVFFWQREMILGFEGRYSIVDPDISEQDFANTQPEDDTAFITRAGNLNLSDCDLNAARASSSQIDAFLFWSRTPVLDRQEDGTVILGDARFYDPRARGRFSIEIPAEFCEELEG